MAEYVPPIDLAKPLVEMSSDELLAWGAKEIAGAFLGGVGSAIFTKVLEANSARPVPFETLLEEQLKKFEKMLDRKIADNEKRKLKADADAVNRTMIHYRNAPSDDRLHDATSEVNKLLSHTKSLNLDTFQTFLTAANLQLTVLAERKIRLNAPGETANIKSSLTNHIAHVKRMKQDGEARIQASMGSGIPREIGSSGQWHWVYCVNKNELAQCLLPL